MGVRLGYSIVVERERHRQREPVVRNALAKNIARICSGSRAGCDGMSLQAPRLRRLRRGKHPFHYKSHLRREHALAGSVVRLLFLAPVGTREFPREFHQVTIR